LVKSFVINEMDLTSYRLKHLVGRPGFFLTGLAYCASRAHK